MGQHVLLKYIMFTLQLLVCCVGIFLKLIVKKKDDNFNGPESMVTLDNSLLVSVGL